MGCEFLYSSCGGASAPHLALDAAQVQQVEVAGQEGLEGGEGLQRRDAASFGQHGQRQHLVVQDGVGYVTEYRREAACRTVHHLKRESHGLNPRWLRRQ